MDIVLIVFFFILGLIFGSFYNVVGQRIPKKESIVYPNSHCTNCNHELAWYENIPVLSYLFLGGKCKSCKAKISPIYPVMELLTGLLFAFAYYKIGLTVELFIALLFISMLVIITVSDLAYMIIPDKVLIFFLVLLVFARAVEPLTPWWDALLGAVIGFGILFLLAIISKGGMGGGDIKLFFVLGIVLGTKATLMTLFLASFVGAVFGIIMIFIQGYKKENQYHLDPL